MNEYLSEVEVMVVEKLIDRIGIGNFLLGVSVICDLKAEHIAVHWQDLVLSQRWRSVGNGLERVATKTGVM